MSQLGMLNNLPAGSGLEWLEGSGDLTDLGGPLDKTAADLGQAAVMTAIERQAELRPNKVAVNDGDVSLTYAELVDRVHGLRSRIIQAAPTGGVVATLLHNGTGAIVAMIAAVTSGRTLVPIDAGHPIERQAALFAESGASAVVLAKGVAVETSFIGPSIIRLEFDVAEPWSGERSPAVVTPLTFPSVVMFTSGSTGRPKGIAYGVGDGEQIRRYVKKFRLNETDVFISLASLSQTGAADIIGLTVGATVRIVDARRRGIFEVLRVMGDEGGHFLKLRSFGVARPSEHAEGCRGAAPSACFRSARRAYPSDRRGNVACQTSCQLLHKHHVWVDGSQRRFLLVCARRSDRRRGRADWLHRG